MSETGVYYTATEPLPVSLWGRLTAVGLGHVCTTSILTAFLPLIISMIASSALFQLFPTRSFVILTGLSPILGIPLIFVNVLLFTMTRFRFLKWTLPRTVRCMANYARLGTLLSSASLLILTPWIVLHLSLLRGGHGNTPAQLALTLLGSTIAALCIVGSYPLALALLSRIEKRKTSPPA